MDIEVNNIRIHYEVLGNGKPIILLNPNISNNIKNSEKCIIEKAGHCNYIFNNNDFYNRLNEFLEK